MAQGIHKTDQHLVENFTTNENEAFLRMKEDPLVLIKQKELEQRQQVYDNPMALKQIQKEIAKLKEGSRKSKKKDKKDKKDKKHKKSKKHKSSKKHHKRHRSSSSESKHRRRRRHSSSPES